MNSPTVADLLYSSNVAWAFEPTRFGFFSASSVIFLLASKTLLVRAFGAAVSPPFLAFFSFLGVALTSCSGAVISFSCSWYGIVHCEYATDPKVVQLLSLECTEKGHKATLSLIFIL